MIRPAHEPDPSTVRELRAAREIADAFLTAAQPVEVYRLALQRVVPLVEASFGSVFLRVPDDPDLLHVVAAHEWPADHADYLDALRIRVGRGPTGRAVAEARPIEVPDLFADAETEDWWEVARELGFAAFVSLPLERAGHDPVGAITFYFQAAGDLSAADRGLLRLVSAQLAATVEKAELIEGLREANALLRAQNVELEARYRQAEEARRLKGEFLANVSHELRTPLTAILGYAFLLRETLPDDSEEAHHAHQVEDAATALLHLINQLLDLTNLKLGRTTLDLEACDAVALGRAALACAGPPPPGVEVAMEAPDQEVSVHTDPSRVIRILELLLGNAVKFTAEGTVTVRVEEEEGGAVRWEVQDTGIGIPAELREAVFEDFRQGDGSTTRTHGGAGMGLALARHLARRLGGDLTLEPTAGPGSTFRLVLPQEGPPETPEEPSDEGG